MAEERNRDIGIFARHPLRTMSGAFLAGAAMGMGTAAGKHRRNRSSLGKILNR